MKLHIPLTVLFFWGGIQYINVSNWAIECCWLGEGIIEAFFKSNWPTHLSQKDESSTLPCDCSSFSCIYPELLTLPIVLGLRCWSQALAKHNDRIINMYSTRQKKCLFILTIFTLFFRQQVSTYNREGVLLDGALLCIRCAPTHKFFAPSTWCCRLQNATLHFYDI